MGVCMNGLKVNQHINAAHDPVVAALLVVVTIVVVMWALTRRYR